MSYEERSFAYTTVHATGRKAGVPSEDLRGCVKREVGLGSLIPSAFHSSPVPNKPDCFCGREAPRKKKKKKKKMDDKPQELCEQGGGSGLSHSLGIPLFPCP